MLRAAFSCIDKLLKIEYYEIRMDERLITVKINWKTPQWTAGAAALCCGMATHMVGLVTMLHNNDDIGQMPYGYGTGITSGRWLLTILGDLMTELGFSYNLHWVNGILFLLMIALAAVMTADILRLRSRMYAGLMGALFVVFPSVTGTMMFRYTVTYYGISLLLALGSVWLTERYRYGYLPGAVCLALSMGIYQAYVPFAITLFVLLLLQKTLKGEMCFTELVKRGFFYCLILVIGLVMYFLCLKLSLILYGTQLSDYNGVNSMGKISPAQLPQLLKLTVYNVCMLPLDNYCGLAGMKLIRICYILVGIVTGMALLFVLMRHVKKPLLIALSIVLCGLLPVAINFIQIMCPDGWVYTLMVYPFVLIVCVPMVIVEAMEGRDRWKKLTENLLAIVLALLSVCYAYETNVVYSAQYYENRQVENYLSTMIAQVRMTEGFDAEKEWAFIGQIEDPLLRSGWDYEMRYGGSESAEELLNRPTRWYWFQVYCGYWIPSADETTVAQLSQTDEVRQMPCWPEQGSIKVIGDTVVIKCQNLE